MFIKKTIFDVERCPHCNKESISIKKLVENVMGITECPDCKGKVSFKTSIYLTMHKYPRTKTVK